MPASKEIYNIDIMPSFIETYPVDKKVCDDLIKYYHEDTRYKRVGYIGAVSENKVIQKIDTASKESIDVTFHNDTQHKAIAGFFKVLTPCLTQYMKRYGISYALKTEYTNLISMFPPLGGYKSFHHERTTARCRRQLVYMLYLNDIADGGGTEFPFQKIQTTAKKGNLLIWPSDFTHRHRGIVSPTTTKYIATGWFQISH
tara:strand:+ start:60 stop:659 length:600 start_codon:yes stop_codon:yes gene_type:complete